MSAPFLLPMNGPHKRLVYVLRLVRLLFVAVALCLMLPGVARAEDGVASFVGKQPSGLTGLGRVAVATENPTHLTAAAGAGVAFTGEQKGESGGHTRVGGSLGLALQPLRFLSGAILLDGRWDKHPDDVLGSSSTFVGEPRLLARVARDVSRSIAIGGQLGLWVPGEQAPSVRFDASTLDANLLFTLAPPGTELAIAANLGYRLDGSGKVVEDADRPRLRQGDRISLGLSDFDALLLGAGASKRLGRAELLGELTWDVLLGDGAPGAVRSPLRAGLGGRYAISENLQAELRTEILLGKHPSLDALAGFAPFEPRLSVIAGLRWTLPFEKKVAPDQVKPVDQGTNVTPPPAVVVLGSVEGRVTSESGAPLAGARVIATAQDGEHVTETGADGTYRIAGLPLGRVVVVVKAPGQVDATVETNVEARTPARVEIVTKRAIKPGQLRGLVRSFSGKALAATVRVEPAGIETKTDADGMFQIDVPPGAYQVVIAAPGHTGQRRPVQVEENGVTVLNADLRPGPP